VTCYTEGFSHFVSSMTAPVASGWSGCRMGDVAALNALGLNWTPSKGDGDEEEPVQRGADHWRAEGAPGGNCAGGFVPQARDLGGDLLQLA
jgi:hypothetical protein